MRGLLNAVFSVCLVGLGLFNPNNSQSGDTTRINRDVPPCLTKVEIDKAVISLSRQYDEAQLAQRLLRQSSEVSTECRRRVVATVMKAMGTPDLDISRNQADANLWREGAVLLGDLQATQSLDLLLSHITMTDGEWSATTTHQPVPSSST